MASVALHRRRAPAPRRGSAFVSPVISSSSEDSGDEVEEQPQSQPRRQSRWSRESSSCSSSSERSDDSSSFSVDEGDIHELASLTDAYEDFTARRTSHVSSQSSVAKLDRLRRIFLNMPAKQPREKKTKPMAATSRHREPQKIQPKPQKKVNKRSSSSSVAGTSSNSSGVEENQREMRRVEPPRPLTLTLPIDHHVKTLSEQIQRLAKTHDAHAQQWHAMLTQAIAELQFVKQQEEHALQSHVQLLQESYALRLEVFEQQYRAKVAEIRDQLQQEIAQHKQKSDVAIVATAKRLQEQAQQLLLQTHGCSNQQDTAVVLPSVSDDPAMTLNKTNQFLQRQQQREAARQSRLQPLTKPQIEPKATDVVLSPVSKQRAKLKVLEQKLALFPRKYVERVTRSMENHACERRGRGDATSAAAAMATVLATAHQPRAVVCGEDALHPTPLSPLRKRASYWHDGISKESPSEVGVASPGCPEAALSRRFLRPEEETELRMLRNSIGLAKDWMEQNHSTRS